MNNKVAEVWTEDKVINELQNTFNKDNIHRQSETHSISQDLKLALNGGKPEAIIVEDGRPYILIEVKGAKQSFDKAKSETKEYLNTVYKNGIRIPFGLAVKEENICVYYLDKDGCIIECVDQNNNEIDFIPTKDEFQNLQKNFGKIVIESNDELTSNDLQKFCNDVNKELHSDGIVENERAKVFTAFLISLLDSGFRTKYLNESARADKVEEYKNSGSLKDGEYMNAVFNSVSKDVASIIQQIEETKGIKISKKIKDSLETKEGCAIWNLTGKMLSNTDSGKFVKKLFNSAYLLGDIYETFYTYAGKNSTGQYFTPRHAVEFMVELTEIIRGKKIDYMNDIIYDPACGVGGFLISGFKKAIHNARISEHEKAKEIMGMNGLFGVEFAPDVASIAKINLLLRGDGRTGIIEGDSLDGSIASKLDAISQKRKQELSGNKYFIDRKIRPTITLMNPPFPAKKEDPKAYEFITHAIEVSEVGSYIAALIPTSCILKAGTAKNNKGKNNEQQFRQETLKNCQLKAVITLPQDLFAPKATINTSIIILEKTGKPHKTTNDIIFSRCNFDGYKLNKATGVRKLDEQKKIDNDFYNLNNIWLADYFQKNNLNVPLKFINWKLSKIEVDSGAEWTPEPRLTGKTLVPDVIENFKEIYSQLLGSSIYKSIQNGTLDFSNFKSRTYDITPVEISKTEKALKRKFNSSSIKVSDLFTYKNGNFKGDLENLDKYGNVAIVSASEFNNGIVGYINSVNSISTNANGISVAKNGKPCVCRVQTQDMCLLTGDVLFIKPKIKLNEKHLLILASVLEQKQWRFSYGRKLTWDRFKDLDIFE